MHFLTRLACLICILLPALAAAEVVCDNGTGHICIETVQTDTGVTFWAENRNPLLPVTLTLHYDLKNMLKPEQA